MHEKLVYDRITIRKAVEPKAESLFAKMAFGRKNGIVVCEKDGAGMNRDKEKRKEKPDMEDGLKAKAVNYIRRLREAFPGDAIFGRSDMMKEIDLKASRASEFLKELEGQGIIEPVTGHGKGKYRFKNQVDTPAQNDVPVKLQKAKDAGKSQEAEDLAKPQKTEDPVKPQKTEDLAKPQKAEDPVKPQKTEVKEPVQAKSSFSGCKITEELPVWLL